MALGTHGAITVSGQVQDPETGRWVKPAEGAKPERYRASCRYRDKDGRTLTVERIAGTKGQARAKLNKALADHDREQELRATGNKTTLRDAAETWLAQVRRNTELSPKTKRLYGGTWDRHIAKSELADLPLGDVTVPALRTFLQELADQSGTQTAKVTRSVLSGILSLAVDDGLVSINACRGLRPIKAAKAKESTRDTRRALTAEERQHLIKTADEHPRAKALDLGDVIAFQAATGARIAEVLAQKWADVDVDSGTVRIRGTKSKDSDRTVALPEAMVERLRKRARISAYVFTSPEQRRKDRPRDYSNVAHAYREVLDAAGLEWATPHSLRRTAATLILESGLAPMQAAAQLGHSDPSFTLRVYGAKRAEPSREAGSALAW